jgi:hypothetical protein
VGGAFELGGEAFGGFSVRAKSATVARDTGERMGERFADTS